MPQHFEEFYRSSLRFCLGVRLRSLSIASLYTSWAAANDAPSMNLRQVRRAMVNIGHCHLKSNGMYFSDVQLAGDAPHVPDNFPDGPPPPAKELGIVGRIDRISLELDQLRREVTTGGAR